MWWCRRCCARSRRRPGGRDENSDALAIATLAIALLPAPAVAAHGRHLARPAAAACAAGRAACPQRAARPATAPHAPSAPPLLGGSGSAPGAGLGESAVTGADASASAPPSGGDPLVENGLGSPLCGVPAELPAAGRRNCETSGFEAAGAPTGNYGLDVHIDTGLLGLTSQTLLQDYLIEPVWMGLVWVVHALIVALEWCFTLDLLDSAVLGGLERSLRATQILVHRPVAGARRSRSPRSPLPTTASCAAASRKRSARAR